MGVYERRRVVSIPRLISLVIGVIFVVLGFLMFIAVFTWMGSHEPASGAEAFAGLLTFIVILGISVIFWLLGAVFIFIGRKAVQVVKVERRGEGGIASS